MIDPIAFIQSVQPLLARQDVDGLMSLLKTRWSYEQVRELLQSQHKDAKKVAMLAMALVGRECCIDTLADQLRDADPMMNQLAEHALWAVWLRGGKAPEANQFLCQGAKALNSGDLAKAIDLFSQAIRHDPDFAEAYNQRAIAHYLAEDYQKSLADAQRVIKRMPCHFGAWSGMGHCHAHMEQIAEAVSCYEKALEINPHLDCVREAVGELRKRDRGA